MARRGSYGRAMDNARFDALYAKERQQKAEAKLALIKSILLEGVSRDMNIDPWVLLEILENE